MPVIDVAITIEVLYCLQCVDTVSVCVPRVVVYLVTSPSSSGGGRRCSGVAPCCQIL